MSLNAAGEAEYIELIIQPIPPDTVSSVQSELRPIIEDALREAGREQLLTEGQMQVEVERTFPTGEVITAMVILLSPIAHETFKEIILPVLKKRFLVKQKRRKKKQRKVKSGPP